MMQAQYAPLQATPSDAAGTRTDIAFGSENESSGADHSQHTPETLALLLTEVDFKWLMAGEGWWINPSRFHFDAAYAAGILRSALASPCDVLRACAAALQAQRGGHDSLRPLVSA